MTFYTINDLSNTIINNLHKLPYDIDLIVGVPRSGMLAATLIACLRNLPLTDIDGLSEGRIMHTGNRMYNPCKSFGECKNILIVDDTCWKGKEMLLIRERFANSNLNIKYCAIYIGANTDKTIVDIYMSVHDAKRIWLWNILHHNIKLSLDMDGVLCENPPMGYKPYTQRYEEFLYNAKPLVIPSNPDNIIITGRLKYYKEQTKEWLNRYNVPYSDLVMKPTDKYKLKQEVIVNAQIKASYYKNNDTLLFVESNDKEAQIIADLSGKPVLCFSTLKFYQGR